jgi:tetratricopeptide (TPR) repeat protein
MSDANYVAAKADFDKAIKLKSRSSLAFYDRALLKIHMGELESAMSDLNSALKIFGKNPTEVLTERDIYSKRAQLNLWMKNWEAAVSDYDVAISQSLEDSSDQDFAGRADAYTAIGNYEMALQDYTLAIKIISEDIQKDEDQANRINMSRRAMSYFEKSAALRIQIKDIPNARSDLESANALAGALGDIDTQKRITELLIGLNGKYGY